MVRDSSLSQSAQNPGGPPAPSADPAISAKGRRLGIAVSRYHDHITQRLLDGARRAWADLGGQRESFIVASAAGSWELVAIAAALAQHSKVDAIVALGVVMRGATPHFEYICSGVTHGLMDLTVRTGIPIGFGLLTCDSEGQALARSGGSEGDKGADALRAAVAACAEIERLAAGNRGATRRSGGRRLSGRRGKR